MIVFHIACFDSDRLLKESFLKIVLINVAQSFYPAAAFYRPGLSVQRLKNQTCFF